MHTTLRPQPSHGPSPFCFYSALFFEKEINAQSMSFFSKKQKLLFEDPEPFKPHIIEEMGHACITSPFFSASPLQGSFTKSQGFAIRFRRENAGQLLERFPFLEPFLSKLLALSPAEEKTHLPKWMHRSARAFYLNILAIPSGKEIDAHFDTTLFSADETLIVLPERVSVLYLNIPKNMTGGELFLKGPFGKEVLVSPKPGLFIHFRGDVKHRIAQAHYEKTSEYRLSLVCEQYCIDEETLKQVPPLAIFSMAGFQAFLQDAKKRTHFGSTYGFGAHRGAGEVSPDSATVSQKKFSGQSVSPSQKSEH